MIYLKPRGYKYSQNNIVKRVFLETTVMFVFNLLKTVTVQKVGTNLAT